jgi:hypothetical protein
VTTLAWFYSKIALLGEGFFMGAELFTALVVVGEDVEFNANLKQNQGARPPCIGCLKRRSPP